MSSNEARKNVGVYIASKGNRKGLAKRTLFICDINDAKKFCSDSRTKGVDWMAVWSAVNPASLSAKSFMKDDGRFNAVLLELDIRVKHWEDIDMQWDFPSNTH